MSKDTGLLGLRGAPERQAAYKKMTNNPDDYKHHGQHVDVALHGEGLLGESLAPKRQGNMAEKFIVPPFSVLSARDGWWQNRKRMWIALGIKSELGRGGELTWQGDGTGAAVAGTAPLALQAPQNPAVVAVAPTPSRAPAAEKPAQKPTQAPVALISPRAPRFAAEHAPRLGTQKTVAFSTIARAPDDYTDPFLAAHAGEIARAGDGRIRFDEDDWDHTTRSAVGVDVECFKNFFCVCFKRFSDGRRLAFERSARSDLDAAMIGRVMGNVLISFNGTSYDLPMIYLALRGATTEELKAASNRIVLGGLKPWEVEKALGVNVPRLNHVDLMEPNPSVRMGLKMLHARLHGRYLVDLPYEHDAYLSKEEMNVVTLYCMNDLEATETAYRALREPLELRVALGKAYGVDLRSKSDAQIGETIVRLRVEKESGQRVPKTVAVDHTFGYDVPEFIKFTGPTLRGVLDQLRTTKFSVVGGKVVAPPFLEDLQVPISDMTYSMGIGGLHSTEAQRAVVADADHLLMDVDVASQYPSIILKLGIYPKALGQSFLDIYRSIIDERLSAKNKMKDIEIEIANLEQQLKNL